MDIDTFLAALAARRRAEQARNRSVLALPPDFRLHPELEIAVQYSWFLQPVLARSIYAGRDARVGVPDNSREQIEYWAATYPDCNWELITGQDSDVIAVEIDMSMARDSLRLLCGGDGWSTFRRTLRFEVGVHHQVTLFRYARNIRRLKLPGIRVLSEGGSILVPPSRIGRDIDLVYADPCAALADPPQKMLLPVATVNIDGYAKSA